LIEERDAVPEIRLKTLGSTYRFPDAVRERIGQCRRERNVVNRRHKVGSDAVPGLNDVAAALAQEPEEDSIAAANNCLVTQPVGKP
jgi:hypothetical protein